MKLFAKRCSFDHPFELRTFSSLQGIFKHSQTMAKTLLADRTPRLEHPNVLGTFNAISSMGFIVGPLIGGHVAMLENGFSKCTSIAAVIFFTCFVFVWIFVEEAPVRGGEDSAGKDTEQRESDTVARQRTPIKSENGSSPSPADGSTANERGDQSSSSPSFFDFLKLASASSIFDLLVIRFVMSFAMLIFRSNFGTMLEFRYGTTPKTNGYITSYNGILSACSGFLVGPLMSKVYNNNDTKMLLHSAVLLTLAILGITLSPSVFTLVLFIAPLSLGSAVSRVCVTNLTYNRGNKEERGMLQGIGNSLTSMSRMLAPLLGGFAQEVSIYGPGLLGVGCASIAVVAIHLSGRERETVAARKKAD